MKFSIAGSLASPGALKAALAKAEERRKIAARSLPVIRDNLALDTCAKCGGNCCKQYPGIAMPEDFGAPDRDVLLERVTVALVTGRWCVDYWEMHPDAADGNGYFLRPNFQGFEGSVRHPGYQGACTFHTAGGCSIFETRPSGCRGLRVHLNESGGIDHCTPVHSTKEDCVEAWLPYHDVILEAETAARKANDDLEVAPEDGSAVRFRIRV